MKLPIVRKEHCGQRSSSRAVRDLWVTIGTFMKARFCLRSFLPPSKHATEIYAWLCRMYSNAPLYRIDHVERHRNPEVNTIHDGDVFERTCDKRVEHFLIFGRKTG